MSDEKYTWTVEEQSIDVRMFTVSSNKKLPEGVIDQTYFGVGEFAEGTSADITADVLEWLKNNGYDVDDADFKGLKVETYFGGTEYGDDCQLSISGDEFFEQGLRDLLDSETAKRSTSKAD